MCEEDGEPTQVEIEDKNDRDCHLFISNLEQDVGNVLLLTRLGDACPCQDTAIQIQTDVCEGEICPLDAQQEILLCRSLADGYGLQAYEQFCIENYEAVASALDGSIYRAAYSRYVQYVEGLVENPNDWSRHERERLAIEGYEGLPDPAYVQACLEGCARFVAEQCCEESLGLLTESPTDLPSAAPSEAPLAECMFDTNLEVTISTPVQFQCDQNPNALEFEYLPRPCSESTYELALDPLCVDTTPGGPPTAGDVVVSIVVSGVDQQFGGTVSPGQTITVRQLLQEGSTFNGVLIARFETQGGVPLQTIEVDVSCDVESPLNCGDVIGSLRLTEFIVNSETTRNCIELDATLDVSFGFQLPPLTSLPNGVDEVAVSSVEVLATPTDSQLIDFPQYVGEIYSPNDPRVDDSVQFDIIRADGPFISVLTIRAASVVETFDCTTIATTLTDQYRTPRNQTILF